MERGEGERTAAQAEADLRREHHPAAVHGVRESAADEGGQQQRHQLGETQQPHLQRGMGELEHLIGKGHVRHHRAQKGDELGGVQRPEVAVAPEGSQVHDSSDDSTGARALPSAI